MASTTANHAHSQHSSLLQSSLFAGQKLWFSQTVPQRQWLMQNAQLNGAQIVPLDKQADVRIVDHSKKNQAPGSHSYRYVELSIRRGQLEDLDAHRVGSVSRVDRPVGSTITASKGSRNKFTDEEDQLLWNWLRPYVDAGGAWKGNEIYKQLERANSRHTFQSWRDRWIKHTQYSRRQITANVTLELEQQEAVEETIRSPKRRRINETTRAEASEARNERLQQSADAITTKPSMGNVESSQNALGNSENEVSNLQVVGNITEEDNTSRSDIFQTKDKNVVSDQHTENESLDGDVRSEPAAETVNDNEDQNQLKMSVDRLPLAFNFTQEEARMLYKAAPHILNTTTSKLDESWENVAREYPNHSQEQWRIFFYDFIKPEYMKRNNVDTEKQLKALYRAQLGLEAQDSDEDEPDDDRAVVCVNTQGLTQDPIVETSGPTKAQAEQTKVHAKGSGERDVQIHANEVLKTRALPHSRRGNGPNQQSQSSQPHSQPVTISDTSQRSSQVDLAVRTTPTEALSQQSIDVNPEASQVSGLAATGRALSKSRSPSVRKKVKPSQDVDAGAAKSHQTLNEQDIDENPVQFVTQASALVSQDNNSIAETSDQHSASGRSRSRSQTPVSASEERMETGKSQRLNLDVADRSEQHSVSSVVQLVNDDEVLPDVNQSSDRASSEISLDYVMFDDETQLTQAWETAPDGAVQELLDDQNIQEDRDTDQDTRLEMVASMVLQEMTKAADNLQELRTKPVSGTMSEHERLQDSQMSLESEESSSDSDQYETATTHLKEGRDRITSKGKIDTQALFDQHPTQTNLADIAALPEPPAGWSDEDEIEEHSPAAIDTSKEQVSPIEADTEHDWTLLPPPDDDADDLENNDPPFQSTPNHPTSRKSLSTEAADHDNNGDGANGDPDEIENWLAAQATKYPNTPRILLKPICYRALESTSMDFDLADTVLQSMLTRLESKGKHPSPSTLRRLPRPERKRVLEKIAEDLLPIDTPGCWTAEDDHALVSEDGRAVQRVAQKHGEESLNHRFEVLEVWAVD